MSGSVKAKRIPSGVAALQARTSRERIVRLIQNGALRGELVGGKYFVEQDSFEKWLREQAAADPQPA